MQVKWRIRQSLSLLFLAFAAPWALDAPAQATSTSRRAEAAPFTLRLAQGERSRALEASGHAYPVKPIRLVVGFAAGGGTDLVARIVAQKMSQSLVNVPYKGTAELAIATAGGEVDMSFPSLTAALPLMGAKKIKALAVTSAKRRPLAPALPTVSETGLPGYEHMGWYGMFAPGAVPKDIIARLNAAIASAMNAPDMKDVLAKDGFEPKVNSPEHFAVFMRAEIAQNVKLIKASGAK